MTGPYQHKRAGGAILAVSIIAGTVGGTFAGQPSIGFLAGMVVGLLFITYLWMKDRK